MTACPRPRQPRSLAPPFLEKIKRFWDRVVDHLRALSSWSEFSELSLKKYGVDMSGLDQAYDDECAGFFSLSSLWRELSGRQVVSEPATVKGENDDSTSCTARAWRRLRERFLADHVSPK